MERKRLSAKTAFDGISITFVEVTDESGESTLFFAVDGDKRDPRFYQVSRAQVSDEVRDSCTQVMPVVTYARKQ